MPAKGPLMFLNTSPGPENPVVLDHYMLLLRNGCVFVIVGNMHADWFRIGYVKYCETDRESPWGRGLKRYERLVKRYELDEIYGRGQRTLYIPFFDKEVPVALKHEIAEVLDPLRRADEIISRPNDELELLALNALESLSEGGGASGSVGVTGSLLAKIHNPVLSDIDLVVYGPRESLAVVEFVRENPEVFEPFSGQRLSAWCEGVAKRSGVPPKLVLKFYRNWRRGLFGGRDYSIIYSNGIYADILTAPAYRSVQRVKAEATLAGGIEALNYPSVTRVEGLRLIEGAEPPFPVEEIMSFESLYIPGLFEGGRYLVEGLLQCSQALETCRIVLGIAEAPTRLIPLGA